MKTRTPPPADQYLPKEPSKSRRVQFWDPSPEEIAAACAQIRANWSESETIGRARGIMPDRAADID